MGCIAFECAARCESAGARAREEGAERGCGERAREEDVGRGMRWPRMYSAASIWAQATLRSHWGTIMSVQKGAMPAGEVQAAISQASAAASPEQAVISESADKSKAVATSQGHIAAKSQGNAAGSLGLAASSQDTLTNDDAGEVLRWSKGIVRVPLEDLGPSLFNRHGANTCGKHCHEMAARILTLEGFATFRYVAGLCHEPDPNDPQSVARHGNKMAETDELLPRLPMKALKGVFAKTHLVTFLQLFKGGHLEELRRSVPALAVATSQGAAGVTATSQGADSAVSR